jgi:hypothetical protein
MRIGKGNRSTQKKPAPVPLRLPQILLDLTWDRTQTAALGSWRLIASALARDFVEFLFYGIRRHEQEKLSQDGILV